MAKTLQERFIAALTARGEREIKRTHKYVVFTAYSVLAKGEHFYYIGKAGSLRIGTTVANCIPVRKSHKQVLLGKVS